MITERAFHLFITRMISFSLFCVLAGLVLLFLVFVNRLISRLDKHFFKRYYEACRLNNRLSDLIVKISFWTGLVLLLFGMGVLVLMYTVACSVGHTLGYLEMSALCGLYKNYPAFAGRK